MKTFYKIAIIFVGVLLCTSCLESNLKDLDTYSGNDITSIYGVYYRYYTTEVNAASGEYQVKQTSLTVSNTVIDTNSGTCTFDVSLPTNFPSDADPSDVSSTNLVVILNISTAAVIEPIGNAPALGTPGDWSKSNQYKITAANGDKKNWTITLSLNL